MSWRTLDDMIVAGRRVLLRVDINVPVEKGIVTDSTRIERIVPTIREIIEKGGLPILLAHFDRPKGKVVPEMSLAQVLPALNRAVGLQVSFAGDCIGPEAARAVRAMKEGDVLLLENTRFHPGEETNDPAFTAALAANGDIFCNDAFSAAHRAHASTEGLARLMPCCAGRLMAEELTALDRALGHPERPVTAIVGGAKVSTKLDLLRNLVTRVDNLVIGGGMANTFMAALGHPVGRSLCEHDLGETARDILGRAKTAGCEVHLPRDIVVAREFRVDAPFQTLSPDNCPQDGMILDAGPSTVAHLSDVLHKSRTLVWNGPLGAFETPPFDAATVSVARTVAQLTKANHLVSVAGGGDTVAALNAAGVADELTYVSTAGGAFLEWMEGRELPGVTALMA